MEQQRKPVPDMECLKYRGTPEKPDIKIFVSHRIDVDSETIDNPLYIPVRCGAVFDQREDAATLGDDTGDNISEKRGSFCELTVQYWAWKNIQADYYGLCHYRRYLSFSDHEKPEAWQRMGLVDSMTAANLQDCGLLDEGRMRERISGCDMVVAHEFDVRRTDTFWGSGYRNVYDYWSKGWAYHFVVGNQVDALLNSIAELYPEYIADAKAYMSGRLFLGFNCFIMKRELFQDLCKFEFDILFDLERKQISLPHSSTTQKRVYAYLSEILYSIWIFHKRRQVRWKLLETQLLLFRDTSILPYIAPRFQDAANTITVVYPVDDAPSHPELDISIHSLIENSSSQYCYDIIILSPKNVQDDVWVNRSRALQAKRIKNLAAGRENISIRILDPQRAMGRLSVRPAADIDQQHKYYCPMLPWILDAFDRALVLSSFSIVNSDVGELFFTDLEGSCLGAVKDVFFQGMLNGYDMTGMKRARACGMRDPYGYVDTSVMVMDLKRMRAFKSFDGTQRALRDGRLHGTTADFLNLAYEGRIKFLPHVWNFVPPPDAGKRSVLCWQFAEAEESSKYQAVDSPKIITFQTIPNPWQSWITPEQTIFWKYAKGIEAYELILQEVIKEGWSSRPLYIWHLARSILPQGSARRRLAKRILPVGSRRWHLCRAVYRKIFRPGQ